MALTARKVILLTLGAFLSSIAFIGCLSDVTPHAATNVTGTSHTVTAQVTETVSNGQQSGTPPQPVQWTISFTVISGPNAGKTSDTLHDCVPGCSGNTDATVTWTYQGTGGGGTDTVQVCVTHDPLDSEPATDCKTVTKTWVTPTATATNTATATRTPTATATVTVTPTATPVATTVAIPTVIPRELGGGIAGVVAAAGAAERQRVQVTATSVVSVAPAVTGPVVITAPNTGDAGIGTEGGSGLPVAAAVAVLAILGFGIGVTWKRRVPRQDL